MFKYNASGVVSFRNTLPEGIYVLKIADTVEGKSKAGDSQVTVHFIVDDGPYQGRHVKFHRVTFLPPSDKGSGIAVHFLKAIGQPCEGDFTVDHTKWRGAYVKAKVVEETYNGYVNNKVAWVDPVEVKELEKDSVPF